MPLDARAARQPRADRAPLLGVRYSLDLSDEDLHLHGTHQNVGDVVAARALRPFSARGVSTPSDQR
jgi:hypothetical protein